LAHSQTLVSRDDGSCGEENHRDSQAPSTIPLLRAAGAHRERHGELHRLRATCGDKVGKKGAKAVKKGRFSGLAVSSE
jgi:hypothetical protein